MIISPARKTENPLYDVFVLVNGDGCVFQFVILVSATRSRRHSRGQTRHIKGVPFYVLAK